MDPLSSSLQRVGDALVTAEGQRALLERQETEARARSDTAHHRAEVLKAALDILRGLEDQWRKKVEGGLTSLISQGMSMVFDEEIEVVLEATTYRDATALKIKLKQNGLTLPLTAKGGSYAQVCGFLWQVYFLRSAEPPLTSTLILDEPFAMVSEEFRPSLGELLQELAKAGMQFLIILHEREMVASADVAYVVQLNDAGASYATQIVSTEEESVL